MRIFEVFLDEFFYKKYQESPYSERKDPLIDYMDLRFEKFVGRSERYLLPESAAENPITAEEELSLPIDAFEDESHTIDDATANLENNNSEKIEKSIRYPIDLKKLHTNFESSNPKNPFKIIFCNANEEECEQIEKETGFLCITELNFKTKWASLIHLPSFDDNNKKTFKYLFYNVRLSRVNPKWKFLSNIFKFPTTTILITDPYLIISDNEPYYDTSNLIDLIRSIDRVQKSDHPILYLTIIWSYTKENNKKGVLKKTDNPTSKLKKKIK